MPDSPWQSIHAERAALAADLADLTPEQWQTPSLCQRWTVHDVLGHLVATAKKNPPRFFLSFAKAGFNFTTMTTRDVATETANGPAATLAEFRRLQTATTSPPGPADSWLGESIVHGEDIRRPLGRQRDYPQPAVVRCLDFYRGSNLIVGAKKRIAGLKLTATDASWSTGEGPEVTGPALSLLLAMTGRPAGADGLSGEGLATLRERLAAPAGGPG